MQRPRDTKPNDPIRSGPTRSGPTRSSPNRPLRTLAFIITLTLTTAHLAAQLPFPNDASAVYVDDSTRASETLSQLDELIRVGSLPEAARTLQSILDTEGNRLIESPDDPDLFLPVREIINAAISARPELLAVYTRTQEPAAAQALAAGNHAAVERTQFLTEAGYEATLRIAQQHLENARFQAAWRTLQQLETHPLHAEPRRAADAAQLAATIARYLGSTTDTPQPNPAAAAATRWANAAGIEPPSATPAQAPPGLNEGNRTAIPTHIPAEDPDLRGIVPTPLATTPLPIAQPWANQPARGVSRRAYWAFPAILDNLTIVNDGQAVTAYDRFTLRTRWQHPKTVPQSPEQSNRDAERSRSRTRLIEDPSTVTAHRDVILAALGNVINGQREGEHTIVCIDADSGALRWLTRPDRFIQGEDGASARGPITVHDDLALVMLRRNERSRRTISASLAAIDLADGTVRWHRFLGSVGALPYQQQTRSPQALSVIEGVAYLVDEIGIIAAIDATNGSPVWIRRQPALAPENQITPWAIHAPVQTTPGTIAAIRPDRTALLTIDAHSGSITASRTTPNPTAGAYLVPLNNALALIDAQGVSYYDNTDITKSLAPRVEAPQSRGPLVGRAIATPAHLYAPIETGLLRIAHPPVAAPNQIDFIPLDHSGNIDIAEGQILTVDDTNLRTYLAWETAAEILTARAKADPTNPEHAVSFAELTHRAGKTDQVVPAVDTAVAALRRATPSPQNAQIAERLFESLLDMVNTAHDARDPENTQAEEPIDAARILPPRIVAQLIERLDRLADTPAQRVAQLLAQGRQSELTTDPTNAVATYQRILEDEILAATPWRGVRLNIRAEIEATRRLHRVVTANSPTVYATFAAEAAAAEQSLQSQPTPPNPQAFDRIARRYPLAQAAISARLAQAKALAEAGEPREALIAGNAAIDTIRRQERAGITTDPILTGTAFGLHIAALVDANRMEEAASLLAEFAESNPDIALRDRQGPVDTESLFASITQRLAARRTGPRLGPEVLPQTEPQLIQGYALRPLARPEPRGVARARYDGVLIVAKQGNSLAWHAPVADGTVQPIWTRQIDRDPILLRTDEVSAWIFWPDQTGGWLERTDLADGKPMWTSRPWADLIAGIENPAGPNAVNDRFLDPIAGRVRGGELLIATGARTITLIERAGRAAALDAATGRELWARPLPVTQVHDADLAAGVLAIAGTGPDDQDVQGPTLATLDPRTGQTIHTDDRLPSQPRWVRITESGDVLAGLQDRIISIAPLESRLNWEINDQPLLETRDAWLTGSELLIRADDDALWLIDTTSATLATSPLETRGRIDTTDRIVVTRTPSRLILAAADGVCAFDNTGTLAGLDAFSQPARLLPAVVGENTIAVLKIERGRLGLGGTRFSVNLLTHESVRVTHEAVINLYADPSDMQAIDGRLLISAGDLTAVIRLPQIP